MPANGGSGLQTAGQTAMSYHSDYKSRCSCPRVQLSEEPETIPPAEYDDDRGASIQKQHRASITGKKMTGRPNVTHSSSSASLARQASGLNLNEQTPTQDCYFDSQPLDPRRVLAQVAEWLHKEKFKRHKAKMQQYGAKSSLDPVVADGDNADALQENPDDGPDLDLSLDKLETIMAGYLKSTTSGLTKSASRSPLAAPKSPLLSVSRKGSLASKLKRNSVNLSSDTEFFGEEVLVPNVEALLDNSKTLSYSGGAGDADQASRKEKRNWVTFKEDILRLTHTLKLKGWRRVPMDRAGGLEVSRLSGALTNAVYVVKPPKPKPEDAQPGSVKPPRPKYLLLRIYGPQVEHLIDRDNELQILRRLCQKNIGPRLLGTFSNGRFEEYLHATTLTAEDLRVPETSKQIAKRMRELHEGIELLPSEIKAGPFIFNTWDKWEERCEKVITWLDRQVEISLHPKPDVPAPPRKYTRYGLICGVPWGLFKKTYHSYRERLIHEIGGNAALRRKLVFAHNDTQYGNLMRLTPSGESPLLKPSNHHKQIVVIDFEYSGQNTAGLEFANHFTEWCYNYHHPEVPWACHAQQYPTEDEQRRFIRSYVMHRPQFNPDASSTPRAMEGREKTNIPDFMLDARAVPGQTTDYDAEESAREKKQDEDIQRLMHETKLWRLANSAQWVAWGIVQAQIPELDEPSKRDRMKGMLDRVVEGVQSHMPNRHVVAESDPLSEEDKQHQADAEKDRPDGRLQEEAHHEGSGKDGSGHTSGGEEETEEFDYLAYAQDRAMFFWGDALQMDLVKKEELPEELLTRIQTVRY
ncbi:uncharacterized protein HMPREF1541_07182 [Cyphellophora europaea CBS 101466]|uniref:Choline kinase N-terminal domain-containing protein n=1 Tax=Cyphellophora europaea (strain CBS 101466) TaxID=1220924 RepID=W2RMK9_CYPE1|nr:uncharacterized protein HMPREF1541_07182 [Cyphellophora europaea CBS 101466]ETN37560.1 hypothetical protein HMPREF1541_07182 [Cyphellophora europaea CBS 101466]